MRILLISGEFPPMQGGVGDYTREMARTFVAQGHDVWVLVPDSLRNAYDGQDALPWRVLPAIRDWKWRCWQQVISVVRETRPDIVNVQYQAAAYDMRNPAIYFLPWRLRRLPGRSPVVVTFHDLKVPYLFPKAGALREWVVRLLVRHSDGAILTNAEDFAIASAWCASRSSSIPSLHQIPIGSNIAVTPPAGFERDSWRARLGYGNGDFVWAYFGFLNESKGGETLIRALAGAPSGVHLLMVGGRVGSSDPANQAYAARIEAWMDELRVSRRVRWTGYVPNEEVSAALLSADAVLLPYRDGISFRRGSLHAALAHGCAIVSTIPRVPLPELHDGENILLVRPGDPQALNQAALRLQRDPALRRRIGKGAKELAQQFTWERIVQRTVKEVFKPFVAPQSLRVV
jgi:glycosyltransferase involved in cell wall biosynthesis